MTRNRIVVLTVVLLTVAAGACAEPGDTAASTVHISTTSATAQPTTTMQPATTSQPRTTSTTAAVGTTTTVTTTTTTAPPPTTTTLPAMQCSWGSDLLPEGCYYWGFIKSVDADAKTLVFDLARFESTGEEDYEFELINNNPLLRTLELADDVAVTACPEAAGADVPPECGAPLFDEFSIADLTVWVDNGFAFWGLVLVNDRISLVQQWWHP